MNEITLMLDNKAYLVYTMYILNERRDCMQTQVKEWGNSQDEGDLPF